MVQFLDFNKDNIIATVVNGKLTEEDLNILHYKLHETLADNNKARWYFEMQDFAGWTLKGGWEDLKMDIKHANDYDKIAMVGDKEWQDLMTTLMKPFTSAELKYFKLADKEQAKQWIQA